MVTMWSTSQPPSPARAPLDPAELALALKPFGDSRMLPRGVRRSARCWRGNVETCSTDWLCVGRSSDVPVSGLRGRVGRRATAYCSRGTATACCARSRTPAGTAATSCCPAAARPRRPGDRVPVPRVDLPARRQPDRGAGLQGHRRALRPVDARPRARARCTSGTGGCSSTAPGRRRTSPSTSASSRRSSRRTTRSTGHRRVPHVRRRGQLEGHRRELPGVLPLLDDPPGAVPDLAAEQR